MKFQVGDEVRVVSAPPEVNERGYVGKIYEVERVDNRAMVYKLSNGLWYAEDDLEEVIDHDVLMQKVLERNNKPDTDDLINSPSHYTRGDIEVIDMIKVIVQGYDPFEAYLVGNTIKYLARANFKENKQQDLEKSQWHINKLLEEQNK